MFLFAIDMSVCRCLSEIGRTIEEVATGAGFEVVQEFCGHGTGVQLHMQPLVLHYKNDYKLDLVPGMVFTIEPILVEGSGNIKVLSDNWSAVTRDGGR